MAERVAMHRAIELAARGLGRTSPNPVVGCVILGSDGVTTVGEGWHERAGGPHAEVAALTAAGEQARGGTAVVTLEPCRHTGRTGPCTQALLAAGVERVVYAVADPTAAAAGGADELRQAGVDVEAGLLADEAARGNEAWLTAVRTGRPFVIWKYAASLDGQVAAADGTSRWITGPAARRDVHQLRDTCDAVAVGVGTVLADDPQLTVRDLDPPPTRQPLRVVFDRHRRTPPRAKVCDGTAETVLTVDPPADALAALHRRGVRSLLLEGGPTLAGSFWREELVDKVVGYLAPALLGSGRWPTLRDAGWPSIDEVARLHLTELTRVGDDIKLVAYPDRAG